MEINKKKAYDQHHQYLKYKEFDSKMPIQERIDRSFINAIEIQGIHFAIMEWIVHQATSQELVEIYNLIHQELDNTTLFELR